MVTVPVGPWLPDQPDYQNPGSTEALNVIPAARSYRPLPGFVPTGGAMDARVQGAISVRGIDGTIKNFAGDATKLYDWDGVTWNDVTRTTGGAYATGSDGGWEFEQFGDLVVAVNGIDAPQK